MPESLTFIVSGWGRRNRTGEDDGGRWAVQDLVKRWPGFANCLEHPKTAILSQGW